MHFAKFVARPFLAYSLNTEDQRLMKHAKQSAPCEKRWRLNLETYETVGGYFKTEDDANSAS